MCDKTETHFAAPPSNIVSQNIQILYRSITLAVDNFYFYLTDSHQFDGNDREKKKLADIWFR